MQINETDFHRFLTIKEGLDASSVRHCMCRIGILNAWLSEQGNELTKDGVEKFFAELKAKGLKNNSLNTYRFMFRHMVSYCKDRGFPADFFDGFKSFKKTKPDIVIFTHEEIEKILATPLTYGKQYGRDCSFLDFRYRTLTTFLAYTGCRYAEAAELEIRHLDLSAGRATFVNTKTDENRSVYIAEPLISNLKKLTEGFKSGDRVFRNTHEHQIQVTDYSQDLKRRALAAGVRKRTFPHNFRHSYITHMLEAGVPITEVASLVGHKDIQTTYDTYMHLADKTLQRAAMRHPMVRKNINPTEIIKSVKETLENLHLETDSRFRYQISEKDDGIRFELLVI
ncbi:MAG: Tyrosine recombinase XerD [Candidatus Gottesmanbacteria bacterium GW2011_GWA2_47_9]|uniref:Tyrosine recombinase XerD n=1 Tax=Candidatus Gottesmanbacteria bacterium GW2011_GWA2_47_9 TaxID=1618445 RepID=A0A0G1U3P7_9BACT|nr:MAG: Tyrosine recombinase XerD [Candidatus Gottesmanbacteria bacterium GW2011_GWA2_47_9]